MQQTTWGRRQCSGQQCSGQRAADNSAADSGHAANGSVSGGDAGGRGMRAGGGAPRRTDLLLLPGCRRLRHTNTACGTRVRACAPPKLATISIQPTTGRPDLQHATNRTRKRAGRSDHARVGTSVHPKASRRTLTFSTSCSLTAVSASMASRFH